MNEIYQGEYIRVVFEGDKNSSQITKKESSWNLEDLIS